MYQKEDLYRCPLRDRIISFILTTIIFLNVIIYYQPMMVLSPTSQLVEYVSKSHSYKKTIPVISTTIIKPEENTIKSTDEIITEINLGLWGDGEDRKEKLTACGYDYNLIQTKINEQYQQITLSDSKKSYNYTTDGYNTKECLTKSGGVYYNTKTGLKETWYSQRVLPGGGLKIPGRHVNSEGFVCDQDEYICVASSTYPKGTIIETSRGMGKVYDSGCKPGILDIYVDW